MALEKTVGSDLIVSFAITDANDDPVNFSAATAIEFLFTNRFNKSITKTLANGDIVEGDNANDFDCELQETETTTLGVGETEIKITITLNNADFTDGEATTVLYDKIDLI